MTAINLEVARKILEIRDSSVSNFPHLHFKTYESPAVFGSAVVAPSPGESEAPESFRRDTYARLSALWRISRSDRSESTLTQSSEPGNARTSHTGEVARAKAIQRIGELKECAQEEQIMINDASQWDLLKFISGHASPEDLNIFLLDGGTFRVIWETSAARQVGFEFLGQGVVKKTVVTRNLSTGRYSASSERQVLQVIADF